MRGDRQAAARPGSILAMVVVLLIVALAFTSIQWFRELESAAAASEVAVIEIERESDEFEIVSWRALATGEVFDVRAMREAEGDIAAAFAVLEADHHAHPLALRLRELIDAYRAGLDHESSLLAVGRPGAARRHHTGISVPRHEAVDAQIDVLLEAERVHASLLGRTADLGTAGSLTVAAAALIILFLRLTRYRDSLGRAREVVLTEQALSDPLTGLGNRRALRQRLAKTFEAGEPTALALIDLDGFKLYNDAFGHAAGDALLRRLADRLTATAGADGDAYRLGGDEFCVLVPAHGRASMRARIEAFSEHREGLTVRASAGIVLIPSEARDERSALALADQRMYARKSESRGSRGEDSFQLALRFIAERLPDVARGSQAVAALAGSVGDRLGLRGSAIEDLRRAAALNGVGKVALSDALLRTAEAGHSGDAEPVLGTAIVGERLLSGCPPLAPLARVVRGSRERWDGSGYPDGLAGERIPLASRIIVVCAAFDALTSDRSGGPALSAESALTELRRESGTRFDPQVVTALARSLADSTAQAEPVVTAAGSPGEPSSVG